MIGNIQLAGVEAKRHPAPAGGKAPQQIRIDHQSSVQLVSRVSEGVAEVRFLHTANYGALGLVQLDGSFQVRHEQADVVTSRWDQTRELPPEMAQLIYSTIFQITFPEIVYMAKLLRLPPPVPLPQIQVKGQASQAQAATQSPVGPEFA